MILAERLAAMLRGTGVRSVFSVAGAGHARLLDALDRAGIAIVSSRHEGGAVAAADGYARTRRGPGVAMIIAEQALPNAAGGLAAAWLAHSPVLVLVAATPRQLVEPGAEVTDGWLAAMAPFCKWCGLAVTAADAEQQLRNALDLMSSGRPGPALLLVPADLPGAPAGPAVAPAAPRDSRPAAAAPADLARAASLLAAARRPLVLAGAGAYWSGAGPALGRLAELGLPVAGNGLGRGLVPEDGQRGFSWPLAQIAAPQADVVLVAGSRLTQRQGFGLPPRFAADARFIQVDLDPAAARRSRPLDVFLAADAAPTLAALADALAALGADPARAGWLPAALAPRLDRVAAVLAGPHQGIHPLSLGRAIARRLPAGALVVGDGADIQSWMYGVLAITGSPGFMDHYPMGAMGIGTPLAVGAAAALRDGFAGGAGAPVVLITGDGALGFYPAELHAAARAGLRLVVVVGNDGAWGTEAEEQRRAIGRTLNTELGQLPYEKLAEAFGCAGLRADTPAGLEAALDHAFAADGPVLVNALLAPGSSTQLRADPLLRMIVFSDLAEGRRELGLDGDQPAPDTAS